MDEAVRQALEEAAQLNENAAEELDRAARTIAAAHAWAAFGHVTTAERSLRDQAEVHASKSL